MVVIPPVFLTAALRVVAPKERIMFTHFRVGFSRLCAFNLRGLGGIKFSINVCNGCILGGKPRIFLYAYIMGQRLIVIASKKVAVINYYCWRFCNDSGSVVFWSHNHQFPLLYPVVVHFLKYPLFYSLLTLAPSFMWTPTRRERICNNVLTTCTTTTATPLFSRSIHSISIAIIVLQLVV